MCTTCGCSAPDQVAYTDPRTGAHSHGDGHIHTHGDPHGHLHFPDHHHDHAADGCGRTIALEQDILAKNQLAAERNRGWLAGREVLAINLMSSPGAGKTSILERTIRDRQVAAPIHVLEGDQATANDAERIRSAGAPVLQINTGTGCHLDADMVSRGLRQLDPGRGSMVLIENVGNLVCPALFDLGERARVVIMSVTEGEDKPIKYPHMFHACELMLINKIDLLPYVRFDVERCIAYARQANSDLRVLRVSAETGEGMDAWYAWLLGHFSVAKSRENARRRNGTGTLDPSGQAAPSGA